MTTPTFDTDQKHEILYYLLLDKDIKFSSSDTLSGVFAKNFEKYYNEKYHAQRSVFQLKTSTSKGGVRQIIKDNGLDKITLRNITIGPSENLSEEKKNSLINMAYRKAFISKNVDFWTNLMALIPDMKPAPKIRAGNANVTPTTGGSDTIQSLGSAKSTDLPKMVVNNFGTKNSIMENYMIGNIARSILPYLWGKISDQELKRSVKAQLEQGINRTYFNTSDSETQKKKMIFVKYLNDNLKELDLRL